MAVNACEAARLTDSLPWWSNIPPGGRGDNMATQHLEELPLIQLSGGRTPCSIAAGRRNHSWAAGPTGTLDDSAVEGIDCFFEELEPR